MRISIYFNLSIILFAVMFQSCKMNPSELPESTNQTVLVNLKSDITPEVLEEEFKTYMLQNKKVISKPLNIYLYTFNERNISAIELVKLLNDSKNVDLAQTNKEVNNRN